MSFSCLSVKVLWWGTTYGCRIKRWAGGHVHETDADTLYPCHGCEAAVSVGDYPEEAELISARAIEELEKPGLRAYIEWRFGWDQNPRGDNTITSPGELS